jgi:porphobilinogen deaminase
MGLVAATDGSDIVRGTAAGEATRAREIGRELGKALLQKGAARILERAVGFD